MTEPQYQELIQRLDTIIELLKAKQPITINPVNMTWDADRMPGIQLQGTCMECLRGTCTKDYDHT